jgi:hypothetical protein
MILSLKLWCAFITLAVSYSAPGQGKVYDILLNGMQIGELKVYTATTQTGETHYVADADASIWLFGRKNVTTLIKTTYRDKLMEESIFHEKLNEKTQNHSKVNWDGSSYRVHINEEKSSIPARRVTYSTAVLYHKEPKNITELFSERFGKFCPIKPVGVGKYELTMPDGKQNYYTYVNGVCEEVEVHTNLYRFRFKLRK